MLLTLCFIALIGLLIMKGVAFSLWLHRNRARRVSAPAPTYFQKSHTDQLHDAIFEKEAA